jgi:hypothetical protein
MVLFIRLGYCSRKAGLWNWLRDQELKHPICLKSYVQFMWGCCVCKKIQKIDQTYHMWF